MGESASTPSLLPETNAPIRVKARRTEKQQAAARKNGSKSHGPRTAQGRATSAMNALKHGVYALALSPAADQRGEAALYRTFIATLTRDFPPRDVGESQTIQTVAYDMVLQRRLRRANELLMMPKAPKPLDPAVFERLSNRKRALRIRALAKESYKRIDGSRFPGLTEDDAALLTERCLNAVVFANDATEAAERLRNDESGTGDVESDDDDDSRSDADFTVDTGHVADADTVEPEELTKFLDLRLQDSSRTLESFLPSSDPKPEAQRAKNAKKDEVWPSDELRAGLTLAKAIAPVMADFGTVEQIRTVLQRTGKLSKMRRAAWLEVLRYIHYWTAPEPLKNGDPQDLEDPQHLVDATLRELLTNLDSLTRLRRLVVTLERRIDRGIGRLRRGR